MSIHYVIAFTQYLNFREYLVFTALLHCLSYQLMKCLQNLGVELSPRSRRHQAAAASHILSSRSQSYLRDWVDAASHTDSSQSYLQWRRRRLYKITINKLLHFKTKFVSLIAKWHNKTCCWFHSFALFTGATFPKWYWREAHHLSMFSARFQ